MIDRNDLRKLAHERLKDAIVLPEAGRHDGAVYLGGYVVELALKSRICKTLKWKSFPQTRSEFLFELEAKVNAHAQRPLFQDRLSRC